MTITITVSFWWIPFIVLWSILGYSVIDDYKTGRLDVWPPVFAGLLISVFMAAARWLP